jgi:hypothetical protein
MLRVILPFVLFPSIFPAFMGLVLLSRFAAAWGPEAPKYVVAGGGITLLISWIVLMIGSVNRANEALRQREIDRANLSAVWQRNSARPLEVDLTKLTLGRVPLGGDLQGLSFLGPAEDAEHAPEGDLGYDSRGLYLQMTDGRLSGFSLDVDVFLAGSGAAIHAAGIGTQLRPDTSEAELIAVLGAPFWRIQDEDAVTLFFERFDGERWVELELEFDKAGQLKLIDARDTPMLAEDSLRNRYGVTASWPPENAVRRVS